MSINRSVQRSLGGEESDWRRLSHEREAHLRRGTIIGWPPVKMVRNGSWEYGFDHVTLFRNYFPPNTFVFSIVRDPVDRLASHYRMLQDWSSGARHHPAAVSELQGFKNSFVEWVSGLEARHSHSLLWSYDRRLRIGAAAARARQAYFFELSEIPTVLELLAVAPDYRTRENSPVSTWRPTESEQASVAGMLQKEYRFLNLIRRRWVGRQWETLPK